MLGLYAWQTLQKQLARRPWLLPLALILAFWPVWRWYLLRMTDGSDEPWGVVALFAAGWFLWQSRREIRMTPGGLWAAGVTLLLYVLTFNILPPLLRAGLALLALGCFTGTLGRQPAIWGLFVLSLPLIASMQFYLGPPLRILTAHFAAGGLQLFGCEVSLRGTELLWQGRTVGVDAPCSGVKMLWTGLLLVMGMAALHRLSWVRTIIAVAGGIALILLGNGVRAMLLFTKESGMVNLPAWTHEGIGLLVFAGLVFGLSWWLGRSPANPPASPDSAPSRWFNPQDLSLPATLLSLVIGIAIAAPFLLSSSQAQTASTDFPGWPVQWRGHWLEPLPLTEQEAAFAAKFPGEIGVFSAGPNKVILRWVTQPTRKLHSSSDCLRATGYHIQSERPGAFIAQGPEGAFLVEEEIFEQGLFGEKSWKEVSFWFWSAAFARTTGPWWAVTAIQPLEP